jgi:hypothetical protein
MNLDILYIYYIRTIGKISQFVEEEEDHASQGNIIFSSRVGPY